jgi:hypothetical protein
MYMFTGDIAEKPVLIPGSAGCDVRTAGCTPQPGMGFQRTGKLLFDEGFIIRDRVF